jgi:hypothetical protein
MARLAVTYSKDIGDKAKWPFPRWYNFVKTLPYIADAKDVEQVARPALTMRPDWQPRDCDDKAVLIGAWLAANGKPFRFAASSRRPDKTLHHVFVVVKDKAGKPLAIDATYPNDTLGAWPPSMTALTYLTGDIMPNLEIMEGNQMGFSVTKTLKKAGRVVTRGAKKTGSSVVKATKAAGRITGRMIPGRLKSLARQAVGKIVGNRVVNPAVKAAVIAPSTAAILAIPGMQLYAAGVPVLLNTILDEMAKAHGSSESSQAKMTASKPAGFRKAISIGKAKKAALQVAQTKAAAPAAVAAPAAPAKTAAGKKWILPAVIGAGVLVLAMRASKK